MKCMEKIELTCNEKLCFESTLSRIMPSVCAGKAHEAIAMAEAIGAKEKVFKRIGSKVNALLKHRGRIGVIDINLSTLSSLMTSSLGPTPHKCGSIDSHMLFPIDIARCIIIGAAGGYSYSISSQANGTLCDDVVPQRAHEGMVGLSSGSEVGWHTEDAIFNRGDDNLHHSACDVLSLAYLRNPVFQPTWVSMPRLSTLSSDTLKALRMHQFQFKASTAHSINPLSIPSPSSLVYGEKDMIRFSFARLSEQKEEYKHQGVFMFLEEFRQHLDSHSERIEATPQHVAFIDNCRVAHARRIWNAPPKFDGTDRWQRRLGVALQSRRPFLETLMKDPRTRVIDARIAIERLTVDF